MDSLRSKIQDHYHRDGLYEAILERLRAQQIDLKQVERAHISGVDEFHVRGAEVSKELAKRIDLHQATVLDVGCGLGGPARLLAAEFDCQVTGIDLSPEFIRTAKSLSDLVGLGHQTTFIQGDATALPFADKTFEVVWTQHVQMNVRNKQDFYGEIRRVLQEGGTFIYYDIFKQGASEITYPVPWAEDASISHLIKLREFDDLLQQLNFKQVQISDETKAGIHFFEKILTRFRESGPPTLGLNVLMGTSTPIKLENLLKALKEGKLVLQSGVYKVQ